MVASRSVILVFARAPIPGRCKTRLMPLLGARGAAKLQVVLTEHALKTACACAGARVQLWTSPSSGHAAFARWRRRFGLVLRRQSTGNLGRRMSRALDRVLSEGASSAVIIGSDCPALSARDLDRAFELLEAQADVVLKPAEDGGFVLLASRRPLAQALRGVAWSSGRELAQTRRRLLGTGLSVVETQASWDVDRPRDLRRARRAKLVARV